jgi:large subunit ribosomal protein L21e
MGRSKGKRCNTRDLFSKPFRKHGAPLAATYLTNFRIGDYVDIKVDSAIHKGMPHKFYVGKTGKVFDISRNSVGVIINKVVGNRKIAKKIHIRREHVFKSRCQEEFKERVRRITRAKMEAKAKGGKLLGCQRSDPTK